MLFKEPDAATMQWLHLGRAAMRWMPVDWPLSADGSRCIRSPRRRRGREKPHRCGTGHRSERSRLPHSREGSKRTLVAATRRFPHSKKPPTATIRKPRAAPAHYLADSAGDSDTTRHRHCVKLVQQFQPRRPAPERSDEIRKQAITDLLKLGRPGVAVVRSILKRDLSDDVRSKLTFSITAIVRHEVPRLIAAGKTGEADELISLHETGTTAQRGRLRCLSRPSRRPGGCHQAMRSGVEDNSPHRQRQIALTYLYRAAGQWTKAPRAAADIPRTEDDNLNYKEQLFEDEGDWSAVADLPASSELNYPDAVRLSLLRLAGRREKFEELAGNKFAPTSAKPASRVGLERGVCTARQSPR